MNDGIVAELPGIDGNYRPPCLPQGHHGTRLEPARGYQHALPRLRLPHTQGARPPGSWRDPYSARTGDMVRRRFAGDIELFGYEDRMTVVNPSLPFTAAGEAEGYTNSAFAPSSQNTGATGRRGYGLCGRPSSKFRAPTAGWHTGATSANHVT